MSESQHYQAFTWDDDGYQYDGMQVAGIIKDAKGYEASQLSNGTLWYRDWVPFYPFGLDRSVQWEKMWLPCEFGVDRLLHPCSAIVNPTAEFIQIKVKE